VIIEDIDFGNIYPRSIVTREVVVHNNLDVHIKPVLRTVDA